MGKLPAILLYDGDWLKDAVSGCSLASQGLWLRMMFLGHNSERYGYLCQNGAAIPSESIARRCGCTPEQYATLLAELDAAGVPSRTPEGIIFSRRMVRDAQERVAQKLKKREVRAKGLGDPSGWESTRVRILDRDNRECGYCGKEATTVDHIIPRKSGGGHDDTNLVACCVACNSIKQHRTLEASKLSLRPEVVQRLYRPCPAGHVNEDVYVNEDVNVSEAKKTIPKESPPGGSDVTIQTIASLHPKYAKPFETERAIVEQLDRLGDEMGVRNALGYLLSRTRKYRESWDKWPKDKQDFSPESPRWFASRCYAEPEKNWADKAAGPHGVDEHGGHFEGTVYVTKDGKKMPGYLPPPRAKAKAAAD